jgi:hypothetical protein
VWPRTCLDLVAKGEILPYQKHNLGLSNRSRHFASYAIAFFYHISTLLPLIAFRRY